MKVKIILIIGVLFSSLSSSPAWAQEVSPTAVPTPAPIQYQLPYPGMLPGNPLYFLKVIRDVLSGFLISNPLKKADFDLLQADKSIATSQSLYEQNKATTVVLGSLATAEDYFSDAVNKAGEAKRQGMDSKDIMKRLHVASLKYQEVVADMVKTADKADSEKYKTELGKIKGLLKKTK